MSATLLSGRPAPARLTVSAVYVQALQVWFRCPYCEAALEGYLSDPRGLCDIVCEDCGGQFDVAARAALVIT
jgi:transcription elongation factor Elf1